jgi:hypothetical protein
MTSCVQQGLVLCGLLLGQFRSGGALVSIEGSTPPVTYSNYCRPKVPWSIHVVRVPRLNDVFQFHTMHGQRGVLGLATVTDQTARVDGRFGFPVAAINGDFYQRSGPYAGDPRGLQIIEGELVSAPAGTASFWLDVLGEPHVENTFSLLHVTWPDGSTSPIGLNGTRGPDAVVLYTPALGSSTRTVRGRELVLEQKANQPWLPLRAGRTYRARVSGVNDSGNSRVSPGTMVLSMGPLAARARGAIGAGAELTISTATMPSLRGVKTAISGGPVLVRDGKRQRHKIVDSDSYEFSSMDERHPRSAIGWNDDYFFLVQVDGRQRGYSVGMTLDELGAYLVELGCREAMNLDGGASATLWHQGKVRNRPCDGVERVVANCLIVMEKK